MQINRRNLDSMFYNLSTRFNAATQAVTPYWPSLAMDIPSTTRENRYAWAAKVPAFREWIGERTVHHLANRSYSIVNKRWELTLGLDRDDIEDDQLGMYLPQLDMMGQQGARQPDDLITTLMKDGETAECWDGQAMFDDSHPVDIDKPSLGTYSNLHTGMPLTHDNFNTGRVRFRSVKGEDGRVLRLLPKTLIVPPTLEKPALEIVRAGLVVRNGGATQAGAAGMDNVLVGMANVLVIDELAEVSEVDWYLADLSKPMRPFVLQTRRALRFIAITDDGSENVFQKNEYLYGADLRNNAGYGVPFLIHKFKG